MGTDTSTREARRGRRYIVLTASVITVLLLVLFYDIQLNSNRSTSYQASSILVNQVESLIDGNKRSTQTFVESLKESYVTRAHAIAYILDKSPEFCDNMDELQKVAGLIMVDEIHLFDESGTIVGGTVPRYYGYSFDSGSQMGFFKPMLTDKSLDMCQDVTPNTAESKAMMYAICWNEAGTQMVQVGIEPVRLIAELHANEVSKVVSSLPTYDGTQVLVAKTGTHSIVGSTNTALLGKTLTDVGISLLGLDLTHQCDVSLAVNGVPSYCVLHRHNDYVIAVAHSKAVANRGILLSLGMVLAYLLLAIVVMWVVVRRLTNAVIEEQRNATVDQLTGFLNRRAYESALAEYQSGPMHTSLVHVSLDLNGLKAINDSRGHDAGDELIRGCAACMDRCWGNYGRLFRIGGDEFVALLTVNDARLAMLLRDLAESMELWSRQNGLELNASVGTAATREYPGASMAELAKISDSKMYEAKRRYYEAPGKDRRQR